MIIGVAGRMGSGKSTIAKYLVEHRNFARIGFAAALKNEVVTKFARTLRAHVLMCYPHIPDESWHLDAAIHSLIYDDRDPVTRALLQEFGTEVRREDDPEYWVKAWHENIRVHDRVVTDDVRFVNEAQMIRRSGGLLVKVERPDQPPLDPETAHESETGLLSWVDWDHVFMNDASIENLYEQVDVWVTAKLKAGLPLRIKSLLGRSE